MDTEQGGGVPPQHSPDGRWWWDGQRWVAVQQAGPGLPAAPARAVMPHQRRSFWVGLGVIALLLVGVGVCTSAAANGPRTRTGANVASVTFTPVAAATPAARASATPTPTPTPTAAPTATPTPAATSPAPAATPPVAAAPPPTAAPAPPPATSTGCYPLSNSGTCYEPGEFCRTSDHGRTGRAGDGEAIICEYNNGWRWEPV